MVLPSSRNARLFLAAGSILFLLLLVLLTLPVSWARSLVERRLSARFGATATIGALDRESPFSLNPVVRATAIKVAQPDWAGAGDLATIGQLRLRLHILPLLVGRFDTDLLTANGVRLNLVRDAKGRENWRKDKTHTRHSDTDLSGIAVDDAQVHYADARQRRSFTLAARISPASGLTIEGNGDVDGASVRVTAKGAPLTPATAWAFTAAIDGQALAIRIAGTMARPLATDAMDFRIAARADDLKRIDRIIEAGLFGTQPVALRAQVRHRPDLWDIQQLIGTIGSSPIDGAITARKVDGRVKLEGRAHFTQLNFDDLASDTGLAKGVQLEQAQGLRLVPNTRINIRKIKNTDGRIAVAADRVVGGRRPSSITSVSGTLTLDDRILTVAPLTIGLRRGAITGQVIVDQRDGGPKPRVTIALDMRNSSLAALAGEDTKEDVSARVDAHVRLVGTGDTIRDVVGTSNGAIGVAARSGPMSEKLAGLIGFDLGKGLLGSRDKDATLRCAVLRLELTGGRGRVAPLVIDTSISQSNGEGMVTFPDEALGLSLTGAPKGKALLRLDGPIAVGGTIRDPKIAAPPSFKSVKTIFKAIGRSLAGDESPRPADADCGALIARAVGNRPEPLNASSLMHLYLGTH